MVKISSLFTSLLFISSLGAYSQTNYSDAFNYEKNSRNTFSVTSISSSHINDTDIRIYKEYNDIVVDEVKDNALSGSAARTLMLSSFITYISNNAFNGMNNLRVLYYTGSSAQYESLNLSYAFDEINYYALDEGFINFWNENIRREASTDICVIDKSQYAEIISRYNRLSTDDLLVVDSYTDLAGAKIKDSIKQLNSIFASSSNKVEDNEWNQTGAITLIIIIAIIGMTSICVFFLLKERKVIE